MNNEELRQLAQDATPGPWHHCLPFRTVPAQRTVHGPVPAERVDYVSTWPGMGTPAGHSIVIGSAGRESQVRSKDMAFIAAANPAAVLELLAENERLRRGWLRVIQTENSCPPTGGECFAKRCGCLAEMEMLANEAAPDPEVKP